MALKLSSFNEFSRPPQLFLAKEIWCERTTTATSTALGGLNNVHHTAARITHRRFLSGVLKRIHSCSTVAVANHLKLPVPESQQTSARLRWQVRMPSSCKDGRAGQGQWLSYRASPRSGGESMGTFACLEV